MRRPLMKNQRLLNNIFHSITRIKRTEWILEYDLHVAPETPHFSGIRVQQISSIENDGTRRRLDKPEDKPSQCAFAGARFAHQSQRFAFMNLQRDIIHSTNDASGAPAQSRFAEIEDFSQLSDFNKRHRPPLGTTLSRRNHRHRRKRRNHA